VRLTLTSQVVRQLSGNEPLNNAVVELKRLPLPGARNIPLTTSLSGAWLGT
jgi:hypothetical protein